VHFTLFVDGYFCNPFDATCYVALEEKQVVYSTARALLRDGQGFPATMHARTPIARVPALAHGDFWLTESLAIAEYLEDILPAPAHVRILPEDLRERARARQLMAWVRFDLRNLRHERPWWTTVYPAAPVEPLSAIARGEALELLEVTARLDAAGALATWNIAHADLAFTLMRVTRTDIVLTPSAHRLLDDNLARPSVKAYVEHRRPPNPPP
jgi:glutathione S-transferase